MTLRRAEIVTDLITATCTAGEALRIRHGLGRAIRGWLLVWSDAPVSLHIADAAADSRTELVLIPSADANVRLVLL